MNVLMYIFTTTKGKLSKMQFFNENQSHVGYTWWIFVEHSMNISTERALWFLSGELEMYLLFVLDYSMECYWTTWWRFWK